MVVELVYLQIFWLSFYIPQNYISDTMGPGSIISGRIYDYNILCGCGTQYSEYVQTHEASDNTSRPRTLGALTLRSTGNAQ